MELLTGTAAVAGTSLHYEIAGAGPTLALLHGFTLDRRMWRPQVEALARRFRVVTWDARGFGRSALPGTEPYSHARDAAALFEHLGVAPVVAVGHSIGAHQMLELALSRPDLVRGYASIAMSGLASVPFSDDLGALFIALREAAHAHGVEAAKALWATGGWFATARAVPALAAALDEMLRDYSGFHWTHDGRQAPLLPPAATRLGELAVPALVITGGRDLPYNLRIGEALRAGLRDATVLDLAHVGHMANLEDPVAVNQALSALMVRAFA